MPTWVPTHRPGETPSQEKSRVQAREPGSPDAPHASGAGNLIRGRGGGSPMDTVTGPPRLRVENVDIDIDIDIDIHTDPDTHTDTDTEKAQRPEPRRGSVVSPRATGAGGKCKYVL
ncbi:diaminopimelate decarboxylase [Marssonina coronariae]|uniref:Diaminopimelate decarboxylase n=1 Tax=Diplocarpon coronariae TaxID=2795749 RepID=A0A218ZEQ7_9HELO|nr:diaminopimelate decarboxylase [Marssonina coronariae]